jgi:hypothetical protein
VAISLFHLFQVRWPEVCVSIHKHAWIPASYGNYLFMRKRTNPSNSWEVETRECIRTHTYVHTLCVWIYTIHATCRRIGSLRAANNNQELFDKKLRNIPISLPAVPASNEKEEEERRGLLLLMAGPSPGRHLASVWHLFKILLSILYRSRSLVWCPTLKFRYFSSSSLRECVCLTFL